jgi:cyclic-di-GMP phosphodiesterase TipF (flagellum assembly factor)
VQDDFMVRISAVFIAVCMVLIAGSAGAVLFLALKINGPMSAVAALAVLIAMILYNTISNRLRDRRDLGDQIADLSRGTADLARQVGEMARRLTAMESRVEHSVNRARGATDPLAAELGELGGLVKQLAETVAAHETDLYKRAGSGSSSVPTLGADVVATPVSTPAAESFAASQPAGESVSGVRHFLGLTRESIGNVIANAVDSNRIDLYLQPIVTLPQRKVRFYEAVSRLRTEDGEVVPAADFIEFAESAGLMPKIDNVLLFRCVQVVRRLQLKNREVGLFCNISAATLADASSFQKFLEFADANRALAPALMFEFTQSAYRDFGPVEFEALSALAAHGFRFSLDHVGDLRLEPKELFDRSFRFLKVPAKLLLNRAAGGQSDIHAEDFADLLARSGIDLISERIESESMVVDLLDYDVRFGQGFLFSPPRPVRAEALGTDPVAATMTDQAATAGEKGELLLGAGAGH